MTLLMTEDESRGVAINDMAMNAKSHELAGAQGIATESRR